LPGLLLKDGNYVRVKEAVLGDVQFDKRLGVDIVRQIKDTALVNNPYSVETMSDISEEGRVRLTADWWFG
jgi:hypothetical protein